MEALIEFVPKAPKRSSNLKNISQKTSLITNMFSLKYLGANQVYNYVITLNPEIAADARRLLKVIFNIAKNQIKEILGDSYRTGRNIYSFKEIKEAFSITDVKYLDTLYQINFKLVGVVSMQDIESNASLTQTGNAITQILNTMVKKSMAAMGMVEYGRNAKYYNKDTINDHLVKHESNKRNNFEYYVWRGFKTSVNLCKDANYLLVDFTSRVIKNQTALQFIDLYKSDEEAKEYILGKSVVCNYGNCNIYRVDDLDLTQTPSSTFQTSDGQQLSYIDYYKTRYQITIKEKKQPLLKHFDRKQRRDIFLVPELVNMTGLNDDEKQDGRLMRGIATFTKLNPRDRVKQIEDHVNQLTQAAQKEKLLIGSQFTTIDGYVMNPPTLQFGKQSLPMGSGQYQLKWDLKYPSTFKDWVIVYHSNGKQDDSRIDKIFADMQKCSQTFGIVLKEPGFITSQRATAEDFIKEIDKDIKKNGPPQLIVTFIDQSKKHLYHRLKKYCYQDMGIRHQNVVYQSLEKNQMSVLSKILLQMNAKMGDPLWIMQKPPTISNKTMLIGIDVFHKRVQKKKSCIGFVASLDQDFSEYFGKPSIVNEGQEAITSIAGLVKEAIEQYFKFDNRKQLPEQIIIYRDGVGEGQLQQILENEVKAIQQALTSIGQEYKPDLAYILVNKKVATKYFTNQDVRGGNRGGKGRMQDQIANPMSGTIVADTILSGNFNFYLAAQEVNQGTCTPSHYTVGYNSTKLTEETFWQLTYHQCFNYFNWNGAVRVPAVLQYAHKQSYLVGETFQENVHENLRLCHYYL